MMTGYRVSQALYVAAKLGVADFLVDRGAIGGGIGNGNPDGRTLASTSYPVRLLVSACSLRRTLAVSRAYPAGSTLLRSRKFRTPMRALAIMYAEEHDQAWGNVLHSACTGETAFDQQFGMKTTLIISHSIPRPTKCSTKR